MKTKTGKTYTKYQLIESYRTEKGPRQRIILTLSDFDLDQPVWPALARAVSVDLLTKWDTEPRLPMQPVA